MTRAEKKEELIGLFSTGAIYLGDLIDECFEFGQQYPHWISVEEKRPPCKEDVLLWSSGFDVALKGFRNNDDLYYVYDDDDFWHNITHWMPLPAIEGIKGNQRKISPNEKGDNE